MKHYDRIYASIDLDAVSHNMDLLHSHLHGETKIMAVVKTDAMAMEQFLLPENWRAGITSMALLLPRQKKHYA